MSAINPSSGLVDAEMTDVSDPAGSAADGRTDSPAFTLKESLGRVAALTAIAVKAARASITAVSHSAVRAMIWPRGFGDHPGRFEQSMCAQVAASGRRLIIDDTRRYTQARHPSLLAQGNTMAARDEPPWRRAWRKACSRRGCPVSRACTWRCGTRPPAPGRTSWGTFSTSSPRSARAGAWWSATCAARAPRRPRARPWLATPSGPRRGGRPGTLLGVLPDPELHDSQRILRTGDSLILFSDGVTEARRDTDRELYGDERKHTWPD